MLSNSDIKTIVTNNLNDNRIFSIQLFISSLIERKRFGSGINQYRIKNTNDNSYITSLAEFIANIDDTKIKSSYYFGSEKMGGDRVHPFIISINNYIVEIDKNCEEDSMYFNMFGENNRVAFLLSYISDGDTVLPIKIIEVKLIK